MGIETDEVCLAFENIRSLDPRPCREYDDRTARYIIPDVNIDCHNGVFSITLNREFAPSIQIDNLYESTISGSSGQRRADLDVRKKAAGRTVEKTCAEEEYDHAACLQRDI